MNRRGFLSIIGLAPVASIAAAHGLTAAPVAKGVNMTLTLGSFAFDELHDLKLAQISPEGLAPSPFRNLTTRPSDMVLLETRRYTASEIAGFYLEYAEQSA